MSTQSSDFKWFVKNHDSLYNLYPNKNIVIQDKTVLFAEDTFDKALSRALENGLEIGSFIIQECAEGEESYTQSFSSRVIFD